MSAPNIMQRFVRGGNGVYCRCCGRLERYHQWRCTTCQRPSSIDAEGLPFGLCHANATLYCVRTLAETDPEVEAPLESTPPVEPFHVAYSEIYDHAPAVLQALTYLEGVLRDYPRDVARQACAAALWRQTTRLAVAGPDREIRRIDIRDGGRMLSVDLRGELVPSEGAKKRVMALSKELVDAVRSLSCAGSGFDGTAWLDWVGEDGENEAHAAVYELVSRFLWTNGAV